jgi:chloramphenicol O-acetyltransferase
MLDVVTAVVRYRNQPRSFALALIFLFHKTYMIGFYSL